LIPETAQESPRQTGFVPAQTITSRAAAQNYAAATNTGSSGRIVRRFPRETLKNPAAGTGIG
jgi:hypothetical protein